MSEGSEIPTERRNTPAEQLQQRALIRALIVHQDLQMRQRLPVQHKPLPALHRVVHIEVLHAQNILVDVQLAQIPVQPLAAPSHHLL